jgi:hypothetical protein
LAGAVLSSAKVITGTTVGALLNGNIINVPVGTKVSALKTALSVSANATVEILAGTGGSAVTNQSTTDVTATMVIAVTAQDASKTEYSITMAVPVASNANAITAFSFSTQTGAATIDSNAHTVNIEVINGTSLANLIATFTLSIGATAKVGVTNQDSGTNANDYTSSVSYMVTAQDKTSIQNWTVNVTVAAMVSNATEITAFSFGSSNSVPATIRLTFKC